MRTDGCETAEAVHVIVNATDYTLSSPHHRVVPEQSNERAFTAPAVFPRPPWIQSRFQLNSCARAVSSHFDCFACRYIPGLNLGFYAASLTDRQYRN